MTKDNKKPCPLRQLFEKTKNDPHATLEIAGHTFGLKRMARGGLVLMQDGEPARITASPHKDTYDAGWDESYRELYNAARLLHFGHDLSDALLGLPRLKVIERFTFWGLRKEYALIERARHPYFGAYDQELCFSRSKSTLQHIASLLRDEAREKLRYD